MYRETEITHEGVGGQEVDSRLEYEKRREELVELAKQGRDSAISYRNFKVGCAVMAKSKDGRGYVMHNAGNLKFTPGSPKGDDKRCAERNALDSILEEDVSEIMAIVTVSRETGVEAGEHPEHEALHPCGGCRNMLRDLVKQGVIKDSTIIYNVNDDAIPEADIDMIGEERTVGALLDEYKDDLIEDD